MANPAAPPADATEGGDPATDATAPTAPAGADIFGATPGAPLLGARRGGPRSDQAPASNTADPGEWLASFAEELGRPSPVTAIADRRAHRAEARSTAASALLKALIAVSIAAALFTWLFGVALVRGAGMGSTMGDGDVALYYRPLGGLVADDVVVYQGADGKQLVGRVVALPGDTVEATIDGILKINDAEQPAKNGEETFPASGGIDFPVTLGDGQYFVLGDGRMRATDSRQLGPIGLDGIDGKVIALLRFRGI